MAQQQQTAQAVVAEVAVAPALIDEQYERFTLLFNTKLIDGDVREFGPREPYRMSAVGPGWSDQQNALFERVFKLAQCRSIDADGRDNGNCDNELNDAADQLLAKFRSDIWPSWCQGLVDDEDEENE